MVHEKLLALFCPLISKGYANCFLFKSRSVYVSESWLRMRTCDLKAFSLTICQKCLKVVASEPQGYKLTLATFLFQFIEDRLHLPILKVERI